MRTRIEEDYFHAELRLVVCASANQLIGSVKFVSTITPSPSSCFSLVNARGTSDRSEVALILNIFHSVLFVS